jgi:tetratricopeptide (TPR) repeat protein
MKFKVLASIFLSFSAGSTAVFAQSAGDSATPKRTPTPPPVVRTSPTPKLSETLSKNLEALPKDGEIPRERREQAYAKLLEGQRYIWSMSRLRSQMGTATGARLAKQALQKAVELDPTLAEGYTALAELALTTPPNDIDEAIMLATIAVKIDKNNFGAHRILSRLYTIKSRLNDGNGDGSRSTGGLDQVNAQKAIGEWKEIARLDPRNAEGAFLSEFYKRTNKLNERIEALQKWLASAAPIETRFYRTVMGNQEDLSPESAAVKLGEALLDAGRIQEAVEVLNRAIADDPENTEALELLRRALEAADGPTAATAIQSIQQAIYANPENSALLLLLAQVQARTGNAADAAKFLNESVAKLAQKDKSAAANLQIALGDIYRDSERFDEAIAAYKSALSTFGIDKNALATDDEREFAVGVYEKIIQTLKLADRFTEAKTVIEGSRQVLGKEDSFTDRQLIAFYRETGKKQEALQTIRAARARFPDDTSFLRLEASVLTEMGKVEEGVAIIKTLVGKKVNAVPSAAYDDFSNYLFISMLYSDGKRGKEAIEAANQAYSIADSEERKQIAKLTLATAQQMSGDFKSAEATLRGILAQSPNNPIALNNLGYFLVERNEKLDEALKLIQQAVKVDPNNPSYLDSLGWAYFKLGRLDLAEENLKKALRTDASSATIQEHLGDVYQKQGKTDQAKIAWQKALNLASDTEQINGIKLKLNKKTAK